MSKYLTFEKPNKAKPGEWIRRTYYIIARHNDRIEVCNVYGTQFVFVDLSSDVDK